MQHGPHSRFNAYGLFTLQPIGDLGWKVRCHGYDLTDAIPYEQAHKRWRELIDMTSALDGDAKFLAIAWANAAACSDTLRDAQTRGTELLERARAAEGKIKNARERLYTLKFQIDQGAEPIALDRCVGEILDELRDATTEKAG